MLRFAPRPTGDMDIQSLRIALLNYLVSQHRDEDFIIRIEDTEKEKNIEGKDQEILDILSLFNISYSQVVYQSQNFRFHAAMALDLLHKKKAFTCFCSDEWLQKKREEAKVGNEEYSYDDACRNLPAELVIDNENPFTVRIARPENTLVINDMLQGKLTFDPDEVDSFIIMNRDKTPTNIFASGVDDMLNDISFILADTTTLQYVPKQVHIRNQLGYDKTIEYAHLSPFTDENNELVSLSIVDLLSQGYLPDAISNYLVSIGNNLPKEIFTLDEAKEWFTPDMLQCTSVSFSIDELKKFNQAHLKKMDSKELSRYVGFADAEIGELARIFLDDVTTTQELKTKIEPIFAPRNVPQQYALDVEKIIQCIKRAPYFDEYAPFKHYIMQETSLQEEQFTKALSFVLINNENAPDLEKVYKTIKNYIGEIIK